MINLRLLQQTIECYERLGYEYIEVPWLVNEDVALMTIPEGKNSNCIKNDGRCFVGSAEQGFLQLTLENKTEKDKLYVSFTPCLRIGDKGVYSREYFYKVELSAFTDTKEKAVQFSERMLKDAKDIFSFLLKDVVDIKKETDTNTDLNYNDVEIGSYGYRNIGEDLYLVYGTGLALPRLSMLYLKEGYHKEPILKGRLGTLSKIEEEFMELKDAENQGDLVLKLCELSDLIGAIECYSGRFGASIQDLLKFNDKTKSAFIHKRRK